MRVTWRQNKRARGAGAAVLVYTGRGDSQRELSQGIDDQNNNREGGLHGGGRAAKENNRLVYYRVYVYATARRRRLSYSERRTRSERQALALALGGFQGRSRWGQRRDGQR